MPRASRYVQAEVSSGDDGGGGVDASAHLSTVRRSTRLSRDLRNSWYSLARYSPNVASTLWYTFMDGACYSLWGMQLLPLYLKELTSHTSAIGAAATVSGVAQLAGAFSAGVLADRYPRQLCIRAGAGCAVAALLTLLCAFGLSSPALIFVGQALWGLYTGTTSTSVEALFADSVQQGRRTAIYNAKWMLQTLCYLVGYLIAAVLFALWHNTWALAKMRAVLMLGVAVHPIALVPLCWLSDRHALPDAAESFTVASAPAAEDPANLSDAAQSPEEEEEEEERTPPSTSAGAQAATPYGEAAASRFEEREGREAAHLRASQQDQQQIWIDEGREGNGVISVGRRLGGLARMCTRTEGIVSLAMVPYWMCAVDFLLAVGSGMSLPFFSPYFAFDRLVNPAGLYGIFIASTLLTAATSSILPWLIACCGAGRIPTVIGVRLVGTTALFVLATAPQQSPLGSLSATVTLFLCRNALMNSVFGVTRSVIMDCVARDTRARWSAFESVTSLSWAGSAALGGWITEKHGYRLNFAITAVVQLLASLLMIPAALGARGLDEPPPTTANSVSEANLDE